MTTLSDLRLGLRRHRVPLVLQQARTECGLAALAMVAACHGKRLTLPALRARLHLSAGGATLADLQAGAGRLQLMARPLRLDVTELRALRLPAILHWRMDHFVVLVRAGRRGIAIHDPACGRRRVSRRELDRSFTGVALEIRPALDFAAEAGGDELTLRSLLQSIRGLARYLGMMLVLLLVTQALALVPPVATQLLIDEVVLGQERAWLYAALAGLGAVMLAGAVLEALRRWIGLYGGTRVAADCTMSVVRHLYRLPMSFLRQRHLGDLTSKLASLEPVQKALTETGLQGVVQLTVLASTVAIMSLYSLRLTAVALAGVVLAATLAACLLPASRRCAEERLVHAARQESSMLETLRGAEVVGALGLEAERYARWERHFVDALNAGVRQNKLAIWGGFGAESIAAAEQLLFLAVGIGLLMDREITLGVLFAFITLRNRLHAASAALVAVAQSLNLLRVHTRRLSDIVLAKARPTGGGGARRRIRGALTVRSVSFRYAGGPWVLRDLDCHIPAGAATVITGPSGCGKTTLLRLLAGAEQPAGGAVLVDGLELPLWDAGYLRRRIGIVLQDDMLFQGTIAENICGFDPAPDLARLRGAAVAACIWEDIQRLPMRHRSLVGDMGNSLSGGQRQRVVLARALYRQPRLLLLDEATSHLDVDTELRLLRRLERFRITVVSVAHRPNVVQHASHVIRLAPPLAR